MHTLSLVLDVPEAEQPALRYAAEELLRPLGLRIEVVTEGGPLYVGPTPPPDSVRLGASAEVGDLAEVFRWLSGMTEREIMRRDRWGRVPFRAMPEAVQSDPLATPVDDVRRALSDRLRARGVPVRETKWSGHSWAVCLTHDLDALRTRRLRAFLGDAARGHLRRGIRRAFGADERQRSARALADLALRHGAHATFFVKAGASGPEDVVANPAREVTWFRSLLDASHAVGLHPSIQAATDPVRLGAEADRLAAVLGQRPALVRSHYLRWDEAITPGLYAMEGFQADSTLGWSEAPGFRRGTAHPFRLWDAAARTPSTLWEVPLAVMDTTLFVHHRLTEAEAAETLGEVFASARRARGVAVVLWHNCMDGDPVWWRHLAILEHAVAQARADGAAILSLPEILRSVVPSQ